MFEQSQMKTAMSLHGVLTRDTNPTNRTDDSPTPHTTMKRRPAVCELTGKGRSALYADIAQGLFTPPVLIGTRSVAWPEYEIMAINAARIAGLSNDEIRKLVAKLVSARKSVNPGVQS
jgi:prophage regulatory protein